MPRPKKYKSLAEKQAANRAKSRKSYVRHKDLISARRREKRNADANADAMTLINTVSHEREGHTAVTKILPLPLETQHLEHEIDTLLLDPKRYVGNMIEAHAEHLRGGSASLSMLEEALCKLETGRHRLVTCTDAVLQEEGISKMFKAAEEKSRQVLQVIRELEGILCDSIEDPSDWLAKHS